MQSEATSAEAQKTVSGEGGSSRLKWLLLLLLLLILVGGGYLVGKEYWQKGEQKQSNSQQNNASPSAKKATPSAQATEYQGCWKDYLNPLVGYSLKYPCDWSLTETNEFNETIQMNVKHITIHTPDNKYFLYWGYKKSSEQGYTNNDRTGVGAGDFVDQPAMTFDILGVNVMQKALVFQGKIKEYFYEQPKAGIAQCACNFIGMFSYDQSQNYDQLDITGLNYVDTVKLILQSVQKI